MNEECVSVKIPKRLYEKVRRIVEESKGEFKDVEGYIIFVIEEIVREEESEKIFTKEDEEEIMKRLKALGYV